MAMEKFLVARARELWEEARLNQMSGDIERAIDLYSKSIRIHPTAEALTCRGWALSFQDRIEEAIDDCKKAIAIDPSLGNAYNDIGSYLVLLGRLEEAVEFFEKAKDAENYGPRHYPYMNLGEVYAAKGQVFRAVHEYRHALELAPEEPRCRAALQELYQRLN